MGDDGGGRGAPWWERLRPRGRSNTGTRYVARAAPRSYTPGARPAGSYGHQARPRPGYGPYAVGFVFIIIALAAFLYIGINWVTGLGREAGVGRADAPMASPSPSPAVAAPPTAAARPSPSASPTTARTYTVKPGDNPGSIARQFGVTPEALLQLNNITDPLRLQVGQVLQIPDPAR